MVNQNCTIEVKAGLDLVSGLQRRAAFMGGALPLHMAVASRWHTPDTPGVEWYCHTAGLTHVGKDGRVYYKLTLADNPDADIADDDVFISRAAITTGAATYQVATANQAWLADTNNLNLKLLLTALPVNLYACARDGNGFIVADSALTRFLDCPYIFRADEVVEKWLADDGDFVLRHTRADDPEVRQGLVSMLRREEAALDRALGHAKGL